MNAGHTQSSQHTEQMNGMAIAPGKVVSRCLNFYYVV